MDAASISVVRMAPEHLKPCAHIVDLLPLFRDYNLNAEGALRSFEAARATPGNHLFAALHNDGIPVGFAWFVSKGAFARSGYLRLIAVHPQAHGLGVGRALMQRLEHDFLSPHGIVLLTSDHNTDAQAFYQRLGYTQIGLLPDYVLPGLHERIYYKSGRDPMASK